MGRLLQLIKLARESVRKVVEGYGGENIHNQDESGLFWSQVPSRTLAKGKKAGLQKRTSSVLQCPSHAMPPQLIRGRFLQLESLSDLAVSLKFFNLSETGGFVTATTPRHEC
jgi:hypothetical protein